jgi:hypothetical protein
VCTQGYTILTYESVDCHGQIVAHKYEEMKLPNTDWVNIVTSVVQTGDVLLVNDKSSNRQKQ